MFRIHLKSTIRHFLRHRFYSAVKIIGLAVGIAAALLIFLYVKYERGYDRYHDHADDIYRIVMHQPGNSASGTEWWVVSPYILAETVRREIPEVAAVGRFLRQEAVIRIQDRTFVENKFFFADPDVLRVFTFPLLRGDARTALAGPFSVVLTKTTAEKYFGREDPMGRTLRIGEKTDYQVTGILKDIPGNSHFTFAMLASFNSLYTLWEKRQGDWKTNWFNNPFKTYLRLAPGVNPRLIEEKLKPYAFEGFGRKTYTFHVQPLTKIHFGGNYNGELETNGDVKYLTIFSIVAVFLLIIACSNFINLATARALVRAKEIGVRKVVGAGRGQIIAQFLGESLLMAGAALAVALVLISLIFPTFRRLVGSSIPLRTLFEPAGLLFALALTAAVGLTAGFYPALVLSRFLPAKAFKKNATDRSTASVSLRHALVVIQFIISSVLITGSLVVRSQLDFMRTKNLGYRKDHIVTMPYRFDPGVSRNIENIKRSLGSNPRIKAFSESTDLPNNVGWSNLAEWPGKNPEDKPFFYRIGTDREFFDLYGLKIVQGRAFSKTPGADGENAYIVNETAVKRMGLKDPIGHPFGFWKIDGTIIGVVKDFHFAPLDTPIAPLGMCLVPADRLVLISLKIDAADIPDALADLRALWNRYAAIYPFQYAFIVDALDKAYKKEQNLAEGFGWFTLIGVLIAVLGLYGLASYAAERRIKEIGVRKILGAGIPQILVLLAREFVWWITAAAFLAAPIAYFAMSAWLRTFAYRISVPIAAFILSTAILLAASVLTVGQQLLRAASANPADSLRQE